MKFIKIRQEKKYLNIFDENNKLITTPQEINLWDPPKKGSDIYSPPQYYFNLDHRLTKQVMDLVTNSFFNQRIFEAVAEYVFFSKYNLDLFLNKMNANLDTENYVFKIRRASRILKLFQMIDDQLTHNPNHKCSNLHSIAFEFTPPFQPWNINFNVIRCECLPRFVVSKHRRKPFRFSRSGPTIYDTAVYLRSPTMDKKGLRETNFFAFPAIILDFYWKTIVEHDDGRMCEHEYFPMADRFECKHAMKKFLKTLKDLYGKHSKVFLCLRDKDQAYTFTREFLGRTVELIDDIVYLPIE